MRPTFVEINTSALQANFKQVQQFAPHSKVMAMIKANAYGHGLIPIAKALPAADAFGVACIEEALMLSEHGITQDIVIMQGFFEADELPLIAKHAFQVVIHNQQQVEILKQNNQVGPITAWLKVNSGMNRLGFFPHEVAAVYETLKHCSQLRQPVRLMTHFAEADDPSKETTQQQSDCFHDSIVGLTAPLSMANSAAIVAYHETHHDWVRPGIMLYGATPVIDKTAAQLNLLPVMNFHSQISTIKTIPKGRAIGYAGTYVCARDTKVGVISVGYGDGYPRHANNGTPVLVDKQVVPLIGRVSMDMITVDLTDHPHLKVGSPVLLWGEGLPVESIAAHAQTISYELLCHITQRVPYFYR